MSKSKQPKEFIASSSYKKYLKAPAIGAITVDQEAVAKSAQWDGLHGVITNAPKADTKTILAHYRGLWAIEESFRIQKHDLKVRPISPDAEKIYQVMGIKPVTTAYPIS